MYDIEFLLFPIYFLFCLHVRPIEIYWNTLKSIEIFWNLLKRSGPLAQIPGQFLVEIHWNLLESIERKRARDSETMIGEGEIEL